MNDYRFKYSILLIFTGFTWNIILGQKCPEKTQNEILGVMSHQEFAWNKGEIDQFMIGYWQSDSLLFAGSSGITMGWEATRLRYHRGYPDQESMGQLTFGILSVRKIGKKIVQVVGSWQLDRKEDILKGHFTLVWKKIKGKWVIISDHSS